MAIIYATAQQKLDAANALAKAEALVRRAVQEGPVNYSTDVDAAIGTAIAQLNVLVAASGSV